MPSDGTRCGLDVMSKSKRTVKMHACGLAALTLAVLSSTSQVNAQSKAADTDIVESLQTLSSGEVKLNSISLRRMAEESIRTRPGPALNRPPLLDQLNKLAQFTVNINFNLNSAVITPNSFVTVGRIADAFHHPVLMGYRFMVVGHTDASGKRDTNLKLSQQRAEAVAEALVTVFRIPRARVEAVGLGEEQLFDAAHPQADTNRRVQLINLGR